MNEWVGEWVDECVGGWMGVIVKSKSTRTRQIATIL